MDYWTEHDEIVICGNLSEHCSEDSYSRVKLVNFSTHKKVG